MSCFWKGFRLPADDVQRWFYTSEDNAVTLTDKAYFNKATNKAIVYRGFETTEHGTEPISNIGLYIKVIHRIDNYFGDKSGRHIRAKEYVYHNGRLYQQLPAGEVKYLRRMSKELNGIFADIIMIQKEASKESSK